MAFRAVDIIMKKRGSPLEPKGQELSRQELEFLIKGYVAGEIPDYQIASWLMAVYFNGMTFDETAALTSVMLHSGRVMDHHHTGIPGLTGPFVDKHSTGGVGDKISLPLAPIVAACHLPFGKVQIPMMSGRALGHTGGTLDKLESIEGYRVGLQVEEFQRLIASTGFAMTGQTQDVVPADRLLYALRDVTATVESIPLITASILSKKVAEGSDGLVFDVKYGSGAFMKTKEDAQRLAESLVGTAKAMGKKATALITSMASPLGRKIGNFLEIEETIECLQGRGPADVMELTYALAVQMLLLGQEISQVVGTERLSADQALERCQEALSSGRALEFFLQNVRDQGGHPERLMEQVGQRRSPFRREVRSTQEGFLQLDAFKLGLAGVHLGVGRNRTEDAVCPDAGMILHKVQGDKVAAGDLIMEVFGQNEACLEPALALIQEAATYASQKPQEPQLIYKEIH
ncbi:MAG: thymidine phosphorylase [Spirochaetaceae bacterium]|nr:thymidine phosphorylase [Spirochaetaceae bacterium]